MQIHGQFPSTVKSNGAIKGSGLKHRKLPREKAVSLAADVASGEKPFVPSTGQVCSIFGIDVAALRSELKRRTTANGNGSAEEVERFVELWAGFSQPEREQALQAIGVAAVWDVLANVVG
jgi:hypothetical protein